MGRKKAERIIEKQADWKRTLEPRGAGGGGEQIRHVRPPKMGKQVKKVTWTKRGLVTLTLVAPHFPNLGDGGSQ